MKHRKIAFIGAGNMARAMVMGMLEDGYPAKSITIANRSAEKLAFFKAQGVRVTQDNRQAVEGAETVVLAVKPDQVKEVCQQISSQLEDDTLVVSVAAGISTDFIAHCVGKALPIARVMPNTASAVSAGVTGVFFNEVVDEAQANYIEDLFSTISLVVSLEEEQQLPIVTAVSGSGIAYYFRIMEYMQQEAVRLGLPEDVAKVMVAQTALGAAKCALESDDDLGTLCKQVISPGGTTQAALEVMDQYELESIMCKAMRAAFDRSKEITEALCKH